MDSLSRGWHTVPTMTGDLGESPLLWVQVWRFSVLTESDWTIFLVSQKDSSLGPSKEPKRRKNYIHYTCYSTFALQIYFLPFSSLLFAAVSLPIIDCITQAPLSPGFCLVLDKGKQGQEIDLIFLFIILVPIPLSKDITVIPLH